MYTKPVSDMSKYHRIHKHRQSTICVLCCVRNNKSKKGKKFLHKPWETQIEAILKTSWIKKNLYMKERRKNDTGAPDEMKTALWCFSC